MLDSGTKIPENRIHLFDPVGLINDGYGGNTYRSSSYSVRPSRRPTKSYGNFEEVNSSTNVGLNSYDSFNNNEANGVGNIRSYDSFTDIPNNCSRLRSYDSFSMQKNVEGTMGFNQGIDDRETMSASSGDKVVSSDTHVQGSKHVISLNSTFLAPSVAPNNIDDRNGVEIRFGVDNNGFGDDYDVSTPRLWKKSTNSNSNTTSPKSSLNNNNIISNYHPTNSSLFSPKSSVSLNSKPIINTSNSSPLLHPTSPKHNYHQNMSPSSRTKAIAQGRRELMDMVRDLPETFYDLSLKDIVEQRTGFGVHQKGINVVDSAEENKKTTSDKNKRVKKSGKKVKKSESKKKMVRSSRKADNGRFRLRTSVFPIFSRSKKNKKRMGGGGSSFKITTMSNPKPSSSGSSMKVVEKDWWRRKSGISNDGDGINGLSNKSESSETSSSSSRCSSNNERRSNGFLPTCCLFNGRRIRGKK